MLGTTSSIGWQQKRASQWSMNHSSCSLALCGVTVAGCEGSEPTKLPYTVVGVILDPFAHANTGDDVLRAPA